MTVQELDEINRIIYITVINIYITNTVVEFPPNPKNFQVKPLHRRKSVDTRGAIVNIPSGCLPPNLDTSMQSQNTIRATYMDNNNLYQGLIKKKQ